MCGIAGIFDTQAKRSIDEALLVRMNQTQHHRGPDESGLHAEPGIAMAHKRLSIIDLSSGHQPLFNEDGSVVVVFNGEIYNFVDLIPELQALGHTFRTRCDTEVIVHAWGAMGRSLRRALSRHVRVRVMGPQKRDVISGTRSSRCEAALLCTARRRSSYLRFRAQGLDRPSSVAT